MYAEVAVDFPSGMAKTYTYTVPAGLSIAPGHMVLVPFGARTLPGIVFALVAETSIDQPREVVRLLSPDPLLSPVQLDLARWLSNRYLCPLFEAASLLLPPGAGPQTRILIQVTDKPPRAALAVLSGEEERVYKFVAEKGRSDLGAIKRAFPRLRLEPIVDQLYRKRLVEKTSVTSGRSQTEPRQAWRLELVGDADLAAALSEKAQALVTVLRNSGGGLDLAAVTRQLGPIYSLIASLERRGIVQRTPVEPKREPVAPNGLPVPAAFGLTDAQQVAWRSLEAALRGGSRLGSRVFLLHGVTGSGKTELYMMALAEIVRQGRQGIVLVPEIALTPQTVKQFASRFPGRVAILHSALSASEHYNEWLRIKNGEADVVIGSRGAIFAPVPRLGLIVMDEEHEWTYKQEQHAPRYHTRDVAIHLAELTDAVVVLGSATPDVASYFHARKGDYNLLTLPERVGDSGPLPLPQVEVVDLRRELRDGNRSIFSKSLQACMTETYEKGEQIILFLNRRGAASIVVCRECGYVMTCRRCDLPLTYHTQDEGLVCHQCNLRRRVPDVCPSCWGNKIRYLGLGTQKVAEEAAAFLPGARILRWDRDVTGSHRTHEAILDRFISHEADILIGTQMIAKGLHLPLVTLVGVVNADLGLNLPEFRAAERTFQILTQVAGRAGRGSLGGRVFVQTYAPDNYALVAASHHDYDSFYNQEISFRRSRGYPPFSQLVRLVYSHTNNQACERETFRVLDVLKGQMEFKGRRGINVVGPAPCYFSRVRGRYRWQIVLRGKDPRDIVEGLVWPQGWTLDVDPISLL